MPTQACTMRVRFAPLFQSPAGAQLTLSDNAPGSPHQTQLFGTGT